MWVIYFDGESTKYFEKLLASWADLVTMADGTRRNLNLCLCNKKLLAKLHIALRYVNTGADYNKRY